MITAMLVFFLNCLCITVYIGHSLVTDRESQNNISLTGESGSGNKDIVRQLLNQKTLIRMALVRNVHALMNDMVKMKQSMAANDVRLRDAEEQIVNLKHGVKTLKSENQHFKEQATKFQQTVNNFIKKFGDLDRNFTQDSNSRLEFERKWNSNSGACDRNISGQLDDLKTEVRNLSLSLRGLEKRTLELEKSIPILLNNKVTILSGRLNKSLDNLSGSLSASSRKSEQLLLNISTVADHLDSIRRIMKDNLNKTLHGLKAEVEQSQKEQQKLSSAVASLEIFKQNMSLTSYGKSSHVGFTVGLTSTSSSWSYSTLVL